MKQYAGDEIRRIMAAMPEDLIQALTAAHAEHEITEYEARWWGFLMFARNDAYEGGHYTIKVGGTDDVLTQRFIDYVLQDRDGRKRHGLKAPAWSDA